MKENPGYRKILFCGRHAIQDGLQYFWVDTCCIDKKSSAELQGAIASRNSWLTGVVRSYSEQLCLQADGLEYEKQSVRRSQ